MKVFVTLLGCFSCLEITKPIVDPLKHEFFTHTSGLRLFLTEEENIKKCAASLQVAVGYLQDPAEFPGTAHLLSQLLHQFSTKTFPGDTLDGLLKNNSISKTIFVKKGYSRYIFSGSCDVLEKFAEILAHSFSDPVIDEKSVEEGLRALAADLAYTARVDFLKEENIIASLANPKSAYRGYRVKSPSDISKPGIVEALKNFFNEHYVPSRFTLVLHTANNAQAKRTVDAAFAHLKADNKPAVDYGSQPFFIPDQLGKLVKIKSSAVQSALKLKFFFNSNVSRMSTQPLIVLSELLNKREKGLFYANLKEKDWGTPAFDKITTVGEAFTGYDVSIYLTPEGLKHQAEVQRLFFQYIADMTAHFQSYIYEDIKSHLRIKFEYNNMGFYDSVMQDIIEGASVYSPKNALFGPYALGLFAPSEIRTIFSQIQPANCIAVLTSDTFGALPLTEPVFGEKYSIEPNAIVINGASSGKPRLPVKADFHVSPDELARMFRRPRKMTRDFRPNVRDVTPSQLVDSGRILYYKDELFGLPKAFCTFDLYFDREHITGAHSFAAQMIFDGLVRDQMDDLEPRLNLVNLQAYSVQRKFGFQLNFYGITTGLNYSIKKAVELIRRVFLSTHAESEFNKYRERAIQKVVLRARQELSDYTDHLWNAINFENGVTRNELEEALKAFTFTDFVKYCGSLGSNVFVETLVTGEVLEKDAVHAFSSVLAVFPNNDMRNFKRAESRLLDMSTSVAVLLPNPVPESKESLARLYYRLGAAPQDWAFGIILQSIIDDSFFTNFHKTLKYGVYRRVEEKQGELFFNLNFHSEELQVARLHQQLGEYLAQVAKEIEALTPEQFTARQERLKKSFGEPFWSFYTQHIYFRNQMDRYPGGFLQSWQRLDDLQRLGLESFRARFKRDILEKPRKFGLYLATSDAYNKALEELNQSEFQGKVFTSVEAYKKEHLPVANPEPTTVLKHSF